MPETFLITGASSGLGLETAQMLEQRGARVISASRSPSNIGEHHPLDLADLTSIRNLVRTLSEEPIDCVINNAGVLVPEPRVVHKSEVHMGINFLGHFALTKFLSESLPSLTRIVHVTSMVAQFVRLDGSTEYRGMRAYAASKLATLMFALELSQRDKKRRHVACHPGYSATNIQANLALGKLGNALLGQDAKQGAESIVKAATEDVPSGSYLGPNRLFGLRGSPVTLKPYSNALDPSAREQLWLLAEARLDLQFRP